MNDTQTKRPVRHLNPSHGLAADRATTIGSDSSCGIRLQHPQVSARHCEITRRQHRTTLRDMGAGTCVNSRPVYGRRVDLHKDDRVVIGPYVMRFTGSALESHSMTTRVQLTAMNLSCVVESQGQPKQLLRDVSLVVQPGEFVCLLGPAGAGKSTLIKALSGRERPTDGAVLVNDRNLYDEFEVLKRGLVYVPQDNRLHHELTVEESLRYTAALRLPNADVRSERIERLVREMGLESVRHTRYANASGGQKKRSCLANELMTDPGLIFLDEVTSGLDERSEGEMMALFRQHADQDRTVVCITHSLAHLHLSDLIVVLAPGGRLAWFGPPEYAKQYFNVDSLGDIYGRFGGTEQEQTRKAQAAAERFRDSSEYAEFLDDRLPDMSVVRQPATEPARPSAIQFRPEGKDEARQLFWLLRRQLHIFRRDLANCRSLLFQVLLVALVLIVAFGKLGDFPSQRDNLHDHAYAAGYREGGSEERQSEEDGSEDESSRDEADTEPQGSDSVPAETDDENGTEEEVESRDDFAPTTERMTYTRKVLNLLFLVGVTGFWFGCNNAAREIVRERGITTQERASNLRPLAYYLSKASMLSVVSCLQTILLLYLVWHWCTPPTEPFLHVLILLCLAIAGTCWGLFISTVSRNEQVAVTLIPIIVIPQIILSGAIVKLEGVSELLSQVLITNWWGKCGLDAVVAGDVGHFARQDDVALIAGETTLLPVAVVLAHAVALSLLTVAALSSDNTCSGAIGRIRNWSFRTTVRFRRRTSEPRQV